MQLYANDYLYKFLDIFCVVYFNNILIYSNTFEEYITSICQVLTYLGKYSLSYNCDKCKFHNFVPVLS